MKITKLSAGVMFLLGTAQALSGQQAPNDSLKKEKEIEGVVLRGSIKKGAESNLISLQRKSAEVIERVGAVQLEKQGVGNVSVAVTKATGAQKQEGSGQVFIRGLGDRSNSTTMNGLPIPSNDPAYKNIDLGIVKTDMIDFVGLEKVYNPRLWGDMAGANVDIVSKIYTGKPYFKVNIGSSVNFNAFSKPNFYLQNGPDYLGFKQINKPKNAKIAQFGYAFTTGWQNEETFTPINSSLGVDFGRSFTIGEEGKLSVFGFGNFDNDYNFTEGIVRSVDNSGAPLKDLLGQEFTYDTNTTGLLNLNYRINSNHTVKATTNYIHTTEQKLGFYEGYIRDTNEDRTNETAHLRRADYKTNDLWINQVAGEHRITEPLKLSWNVGYNRLDSRSCAVLLALIRISGDMGSRDIHHVDEFFIYIRLVVPCVYYDRTELRQGHLQGSLVDYFTSGRIYEYGSRLHKGEEILSGHASCRFIKRHMKGNHIGIGQKIIQRTEFIRAFRKSPRRITFQDLETQMGCQGLNLPADVSYADYTEYGIVQLD